VGVFWGPPTDGPRGAEFAPNASTINSDMAQAVATQLTKCHSGMAMNRIAPARTLHGQQSSPHSTNLTPSVFAASGMPHK